MLPMWALASMLGMQGAGLGLQAMGMSKKAPPSLAGAINVGEKPMINPINPYGDNQSYDMMNNQMMNRRSPMFSSTLGRYGGFG